MAQNHLKFGSYTAPEVDEDGYQISMATTSTENSGRTMRGNMKNSPLFTVEAYELKWTDLPAKTGGEILKQVLGKAEFDFFHYNVYKGVWEKAPFYAANFNAPCISLVVGEEKLDELSFQVTSVNPL